MSLYFMFQLYSDATGAADISSPLFKVHTRWTAALLLGFSIIIYSSTWIRTPMQCTSDVNDREYVNAFCWSATTFRMPPGKSMYLFIVLSFMVFLFVVNSPNVKYQAFLFERCLSALEALFFSWITFKMLHL